MPAIEPINNEKNDGEQNDKFEVTVSSTIEKSFRTAQVAGMFDVPVQDKIEETFIASVPPSDDSWQVGLIVGPSGSGKSTLAKHVYGDKLWTESSWPRNAAVVDGFGDRNIKEITAALISVGFSSPPSWIKPFHVLSNGEKFRCELAKALLPPIDNKTTSKGSDKKRVVVFDEFTSVVDRNVAKVCASAVAKSIRNGRLPVQFVGVTCHYDVAEWMEADWVLDMATGHLSRRRLRRPSIQLEVHRAELAAWKLFARHHYLSGSLALQSRCYVATWNGEPVAFAGTLPVIGRKGHRRFTRIVTLPDYQGIGIGMRVTEAVAQIHHDEGFRINVTSSHPALISHCKRSVDWRCVGVKKSGSSDTQKFQKGYRSSLGRAVVSFEYRGEKFKLPNRLRRG